MRILLVSPNTENLPDPVFPLGLAFLSGALERSGHEYRILDLCFAKDFYDAIDNAVSDFQPKVVGISLRNVDNVAYPNTCSYLPFYKQIVSCFRQFTSAVILLGGSGYSLMPRAILDDLGADYGIAGEGEKALVAFLDCLEGKRSPSVLHGVYSSSSVRALPEKDPEHLPPENIVMPCRDKLSNEKYLRFGGMGNLQTKRGCAFTCVYCTYPLIEGREVRLRPPRMIGDEIEDLLKKNVDTFFVVDSVFNYPKFHAEAVCREIIKRKLKVNWSCYVHPRFLSEELLVLMMEAGCQSVEFGADSGSDLVLNRLGKSFGTEMVRCASETCREAGMPFCLSLIFGGPGETIRTVEETFKFVDSLSPTAVIAMVGIRVFPGTEIAGACSHDDLIMTDSSMIRPVFFLSASVRPVILELLNHHARKNKNWILPGSLININGNIQKKLRRFGVKGPLWESMQVRRK